jgi:serine/threonine-protein kinase
MRGMIGRTLDHYRVLETLGAGGMGTVYLGEDTRLGRRVAIKVISGAAHTDPSARARFLQEARAASALDHPNICAIYQIGETDEGAPYLVMAHYDGETLDRRIAAGPMRLGEAVKLAAQVADGLAHAHARGVIHRDIKPANVLRTSDGQAKILDFGLAKIMGADSMTVTGVSVGTPTFMSPEQVRAESVDARSDVWAVGVLLYALLAGRSPFEADNMAAVTYAILEGDPLPLKHLFPRVPDGLQAIVNRCLAKEPAQRYPDARALAADLHALAARLGRDDAQTLAAPATSGARTLVVPSTPRRSVIARAPARSMAAGAGAAALVIAAAAGWLGWQRAHPAEPLRIAVVAPVVTGAADSLEAAIASTNVLTTALGHLAELRGISAMDASDLAGVRGLREAATAVGAEEVLTATLHPVRDEWQVELRRVSAPDSNVRWAASFAVARDAPLSLADALRARLATGFAGHRPRAASSAQSIAPAEYEQYLRLERSFRANKGNDVPRDSMVARLEALRRRAPRYLDLHLLEANYATYQYTTRKSPEDLALALDATRRAQEAFPADPRAVRIALHCAVLAGELDQADSLVAIMRRLDPGGVHVESGEARVAEKRGRVEEALATMRRVVARQPSRVFYEQLIRMEYSQGRYQDARAHLEFLMAREPEYLFPRSYLAQLELLYGRTARAESLYTELAGRYPRLVYLANLSLAQMLQGRYEQSALTSRRALELNPDNSAVLLNLADCELLLGREREATALYQKAIATTDRGPEARTAAGQLVKAQCLAHIGQFSTAVALAQEALRTSGDDPDARFQASLVFALAGERTSAVVNAAEARARGMQPRWFRLPWFDDLRRDPEFDRATREPA